MLSPVLNGLNKSNIKPDEKFVKDPCTPSPTANVNAPKIVAKDKVGIPNKPIIVRIKIDQRRILTELNKYLEIVISVITLLEALLRIDKHIRIKKYPTNNIIKADNDLNPNVTANDVNVCKLKYLERSEKFSFIYFF
jgi:hypothetical protein